MLSRRDIARSLLIEAYADLEAARVLGRSGIHARCLAHRGVSKFDHGFVSVLSRW